MRRMNDENRDLQNGEHHLQSVSASSTGNLLRMSQAARSNLEAGCDSSEASDASAVPAANGDVQLHHHDAELDFQHQSSPSGVMTFHTGTHAHR